MGQNKNIIKMIIGQKAYREYKREMAKLEQSGQLKEITVESFWGAVAALFLFQIFGFIIFQAFITYLTSKLYLMVPFLLYGLIFMIIFMFADALTMKKIREFFINQGSRAAFQSLRQKDDFLKFCLAIVFFIILILFFLGYYPLPKKEYNLILLIIFFVFSWVVSLVFSRITKRNSSLKLSNDKKGLVVGLFVGLWFSVLSYIISVELFYVFGMVGIGLIVLISSSWLLEDQIKTT